MVEISPETSRLLESLSSLDRHQALAAYGESDISELAFKLELGEFSLDDVGGNYSQVNFANDDAVSRLQSLKQSGHRKVFCSASVPSSSNPIGGHTVALVVDNEKRTVLFHDPYGAVPSNQVQSTLKQAFGSYHIEIARMEQQKDATSCALITAANLASYAKGENLDLHINDKLWDIRIRHAPAIVDYLTRKVRESEKQEIKPTEGKSSRFKIVSVGASQGDRIVNAFNSLNMEDTGIKTSYRLFIALAKQAGNNHDEMRHVPA